MDKIIKSLDAIACGKQPIGEIFHQLMSQILEAPYSDYEKQVILKALQDERHYAYFAF